MTANAIFVLAMVVVAIIVLSAIAASSSSRALGVLERCVYVHDDHVAFRDRHRSS